MLAAELNHRSGSGNAEASLQGSGLVIDAGVNHAAVVAALVTGNAIFLFENQHTETGKASRNLKCNAEPDYASSDDDHVMARIGHSVVARRGTLQQQRSPMTGWRPPRERFRESSHYGQLADPSVYDERDLYALAGVGGDAWRCSGDRDSIDNRVRPRPASATSCADTATRQQRCGNAEQHRG